MASEIMLPLIGCFALAATIPQNPNPWVSMGESNGTKIWQREVASSSIQEIKVETTIDASSVHIWRVIRDVERYAEFMPYLAEARILWEQGDTRLVYQRISPPLFNDRDYTLRAKAYEDYETGVFEQTFSEANAQGPPPRDGTVRVGTVDGGWVLEPLGPSKTRIVYWLHTDPGGVVPQWAVNFGQRRSLPKLLKALRQVVTRPVGPADR